MREKVRERKDTESAGKGYSKNHQKHNPEMVGYRNQEHQTTTFFITNFPDEVTEGDLRRTFARYWKVGEVYIPAKRDKFGRRFGFARFAEVQDVQTLLEKIEGTWIGTYKIRANLSKFRRGEDGGRNQSTQALEKPRVNRGILTEVRKGISFKDAVMEDDRGGKRDLEGGKTLPGGRETLKKPFKEAKYDLEGVLDIPVVPANLERLKNSFIGVLWELKDAEKSNP
ncbi:hypothetical protein TSUD_53950 [Trifolium subterraneum]|uniref:RRM domain-containing protein n=1 Tax=Trifolium subterraneum TaxID=3900 RepID=A0A2Z6MPD2_TRISU|nr:hypothetical protein TSUD_53950 [Trifolium subterraneum]